MGAGIFDDAATASTVVRVRDVAASVGWYREKLGLEPIHVGAQGDHPIRQAVVDRGVDVGEIRYSANNEFVWFHDLDGNRFELSRRAAANA
jgi:hypothetical protein